MSSYQTELSPQGIQLHLLIHRVQEEVGKVIVGQQRLIQTLLMGLVVDGHILLEGVPGLAKTTAVKTLAQVIQAHFQRIQFTPDLLPADILGTQVYNPKTQEFSVKKGPLFHNIILADEINRAPAKVQSALLEAMQERQITIGESTFKLDEPFIVLATQNPLEQEGTYPLPEAQVDRFFFKLKVGYPTVEEEGVIMERAMKPHAEPLQKIISPADLLKMREEVYGVYTDPKVKDYILRLVFATRNPKKISENLKKHIQFGVSPRASICLLMASKALAFFSGRSFVLPQDVKNMALDVLRHRLILTFEAEAEGLTPDDVVNQLLDQVEVP